jgi:hypothetical protein
MVDDLRKKSGEEPRSELSGFQDVRVISNGRKEK